MKALTWTKPLSEITLADAPLVGGKAAHLGAMLRAGFQVPAGFVITVDAFVDHFGQLTDPLVKPTPPRIQPELMAEVVNNIVEHLGHETSFAVRSSSTDEDSSQASFAGQHSTYYFVTPNRIDQAILDCWMSLWSSAAIAYRRAGWADIAAVEPVRMAVIVQQMLPATRSGVAFSRDPVDQKNTDVVIEACWGLGAALVDGRVSPDHIRVSEAGALTNYKISTKKHQVQPTSKNYTGARLQEVPKAQQHEAVLSTPEAEHIANISQQLETLFEYPQDVEWAYVDEDLYLLQSRPITTFPGQHSIQQPLVIFKPMAENFTEPLTPMAEDLFASVLPRCGALYNGRFYLYLDFLRSFTPWKVADHELAEIALLRQPETSGKLSIAKLIGLGGLLSLGFLADGINWLRTSRVSNRALLGFKQVVQKVAADPKLNAKQTLQRLIWGRHPFEPISHQMFYTNVSAGRYFILISVLNKIVTTFLPDYDTNELPKIYHSQNDMASMSMLNRIEGLTQTLRDLLASNSPTYTQEREEVLAALEGKHHTLPSQGAFTQEFEQFLDEYGHRGARELELAAPRWREAPADLLSLIYSNAKHPPAEDRTYSSHLVARDNLHQRLKPWQRRIVDNLVAKVSHYIRLRENTRHLHIMAFSATRDKLLAMEAEYLRLGLVQIPTDIFFLTFAESQDLGAGKLDPEDAQLTIRKRRRNWQRLSRQPTPHTINIQYPERASGADQTGQCASPGIVSGKARVMFSLTQGHELQPGEIIVAPYTDPAWTPLFSKAGGIVVETGSFLSHAGTVARELHLPCLVDVNGCTQSIKTGQTITVNATEGYVSLPGVEV